MNPASSVLKKIKLNFGVKRELKELLLSKKSLNEKALLRKGWEIAHVIHSGQLDEIDFNSITNWLGVNHPDDQLYLSTTTLVLELEPNNQLPYWSGTENRSSITEQMKASDNVVVAIPIYSADYDKYTKIVNWIMPLDTQGEDIWFDDPWYHIFFTSSLSFIMVLGNDGYGNTVLAGPKDLVDQVMLNAVQHHSYKWTTGFVPTFFDTDAEAIKRFKEAYGEDFYKD